MADNLKGTEADDFRALCMAIGFVVVNWAIIEQQIDNVVNVAFKNCGGKTLRKNGDIPRSMSQKLDFLKDCFHKIAALKPFEGEAVSLIGRTSTLSEQRHDLVHGAVTSLTPINGGFKFRKIGYEKEDHVLHPEFTFDPSEFDKLAGSLEGHLTALIQFSQKLADTFLAAPK